MNRRDFTACTATIWFVGLGGCATGSSVARTVIDVAVLSDSLLGAERNYIALKSGVVKNKDKFDDAAYAQLVVVDQEFLDARAAVQSLMKKDSSLELRALSAEKLLEIALPLDRAAQRAISVLDPVIGDLPVDTILEYADARATYRSVREKITKIASNPDAVARAGAVQALVGAVSKLSKAASILI